MSRFNNFGKSAWGGSRPDTFHNGASRRPNFNIRRNEIFQRQETDDGELEGQPTGESLRQDPMNEKLDRLLDKMEKFDQWRDTADRRFESLDRSAPRATDPTLRFDVGDEEEYEDFRRGKSREIGARARNPNFEFRDYATDERVRRTARGYRGSDWDPPGNRYGRTCWDPPQRFQPPALGLDRNQVSMKPPRFDGSEATNWIARVQYYFNHLMMPDAQRLHYAVMLFDPPASEWVFNYCANNEFVTWQEFLEDVRHRFDRQSFKDYFGLIAKLTQTGTVLEYHDTFEKYLNRVQGVPEAKLFTLFVAGLKPEMQERLTLHRPTSLAAAMALALEISDTHSERASQHLSSTFQRRQWNGRENRPSAGPLGSQPPSTTAAGVSPAQVQPQRQKDQPRHPLIRVSQAERSERSRLGLCWHCPEKWVIGHVCKQRMLCYADEDEGAFEEGECDRRDEEAPTEVRIFIPLREDGSDRDFLHPDVAERLHLPLSPIRPFRVFVGNGAALLCTHIAKQTRLKLQDAVFMVDLHILPIHGPDVILGMDWLESLGKISANFASKTLEFVHNGQPFTLQDSYVGSRFGDPGVEAFPADLPVGIAGVLESFRSVFRVPTEMPPIRQYDHRIHLLPGSKPVNVRPYRYPYFQKNEIERQVREMLEQGIIQRSNSPFSSPVLLIRKKDGSFRFCIDYRALNHATIPDHFPIPTADELFDELGKARIFSKLDLRSGYHQIRMHEEDVFKTAFRTHDVHFEFLVMPFGLTNAPSTFQAAMNSIFQPMLRKFVIVFFDDILIYSPTVQDHEAHISAVLAVLREHSFFVKLSKCSFCSSTVEYLGHLITDGSLKADPTKIEAMTAWPVPRTVKQLRGFLGLTGYYRRFIAQYALIVAPLTDLLKKEAFCWSPAADEAFLSLKEAMTKTPVLRLPDFEKPFCIETDASDSGIGAVLLQDNHPIAFYSKKLGPRRRVASTYHKELYAIVEAVQKWRQYLLGREFVIRSDQKSLKELLQQVVQTPDQQLYVRKLMGYKFTIEYKKGSLNRAADALSRREESQVTADAACVEDDAAQYCQELIAVSQPIPELLDLLRRETASSPEMRELTAAIRGGTAPPHLHFVDGLKPAGLLQPLPVPTQVWEDVSMDFITGLPQSRGYTAIMVVVDRLSKYAHFAPLLNRFDALRVAHLFVNMVVRHHGFPATLVSDRDPIFLNQVWRELMRLSGTKLNFSTAYHPQSDGQTEVRNRGLEQYLRAFTADRPSKWANFLPWAELALNCFHHAGLGVSPFKALYGRDPPNLVFANPSNSTPPSVAEIIRQRSELLVELRRNLMKAQQRMREAANKHRRHVEFEIGDSVLLKLRPYRQHSVARPQSAKLARRYYGPFEVIERVGPVAYRLRLPEGSRIHNVFHVLWHDGRPMEHVLVRWSDGTDSPTWEPTELVQKRFPNVLLEDKEVALGEGVDTIPQCTNDEANVDASEEHGTTPQCTNDASEELGTGDVAREEQSIARSKPTRNRRPPERLVDFVPK
ncbi:uncharacterized protein LOC121781586 [Salvia splendens]|uniref:uncharacterized protein LOC121781586 n=1 Tax=Salvia splendens TaxID=180675 RepID=UPI001C25243A|nr:uncharacterized protein LOC121781586 [Salvia splendens]